MQQLIISNYRGSRVHHIRTQPLSHGLLKIPNAQDNNCVMSKHIFVVHQIRILNVAAI